ncbi:MAG: hypothetical protein H6552_09700 [Chitinophagales bacterium]|nr:hypothetical protein [Chitinophagales bacterium]
MLQIGKFYGFFWKYSNGLYFQSYGMWIFGIKITEDRDHNAFSKFNISAIDDNACITSAEYRLYQYVWYDGLYGE